MKAIAYESFGASDVLRICEVEQPSIKPNEVLVRIRYTSVNPVDWKIRQGYLNGLLPHRFPIIPGWDAAGEIVAAGAKVKAFKLGDQVYAYTRKESVQEGTYAEYIALNEAHVSLKPEKLGMDSAAAIPLVGLTAWQALIDVAKVTARDTVFISAGAGGVGSLAIQFAKFKGAKVITTGSQANHDYLYSLGADAVIDYNSHDVVSAVRELATDGVDVVLDAVGGEALAQAWGFIKSGGRLVSIVETPDTALAQSKNVNAQHVFVAPNGPQLEEIAKLIDVGKVRAPSVTVRSVKEAALAQDENAQRHVRGKVVLRIDF